MVSENKSTVFAGAAAGEGKNAGRHRPGLFRLRQGAGEWNAVTSGLPENVEVRCIAQHPADSMTLFVGTQHGPYRSTDGGESWQRPDFPADAAVIWSIAIHPTKPNIVYCGAAPVAEATPQAIQWLWKLWSAPQPGSAHLCQPLGQRPPAGAPEHPPGKL